MPAPAGFIRRPSPAIRRQGRSSTVDHQGPSTGPRENGRGILSMAVAETQQLRMLERLRSAGEQPVTLDQLRAGGIDFPAVVIGELELNGYVIERVYEHGRQIGGGATGGAAPESSRRIALAAVDRAYSLREGAGASAGRSPRWTGRRPDRARDCTEANRRTRGSPTSETRCGDFGIESAAGRASRISRMSRR